MSTVSETAAGGGPVSLTQVVERIQSLSAGDRPVLVAVDGRCASGKTTLTERLTRDYGWSAVHVDHFFLRPEQRTAKRYAQPGGNVDHERLLLEVLLPLRRGERPVYRPFDCRTQTLLPPVSFEPASVVVVEGSYACHPALWDCYDLRVFLTIDKSRQMERILAREGAERAQAFREKWIPLEELYFSALEIEARCDYRLKAGEKD